jgi:lipopolysaccharide transport system ATP-binding protein
MSDNVIIRVENLGKRYSLRHLRDQRYIALRDVLVEKATGLFRRDGKARRPDDKTTRQQDQSPVVSSQLSSSPRTEEFWALRDINFEVRQGEVVGIIGRNGAGKSTLLKILSRITDPTEGKVHIKGRVASLLEVGTGFHPELTGRENIFLNGAILGMTRAEIRKKFDEIAAFAEVERFLDTPVKRYSSGMYVRLAFAVAAHLEPEILVIDEVLAVGDAEFQKKCLGKMGEVARGGRTVLFVSHNMSAVQGLCNRAIWLDNGKVCGIGDVSEWVAKYVLCSRQQISDRLRTPVPVGGNLELRQFYLSPNPVESGASVRFGLEMFAHQATRITELAIGIYSSFETRVANLDFRSSGLPIDVTAGETRALSGEIKSLPLVEGEYRFGLYVVSSEFGGNVLDLVRLTVTAQPLTYLPYAAIYRGLVELAFTVDSTSAVRPPRMPQASYS